MGRRGPAPQPTRLKLLHGVDKHNPQRVNRREPVPAAADVVPPAWLDEPALELWRQYAPDLQRQAVLTAWDAEAFGAWCDAAARRRQAALALQREGEVIDAPVFNRNGEVTGERRVKNPWLAVLNEADAQVLRYGARFGMTPSDRASLTSDRQPRHDPTEDLLSS